jgi:hypothetical protein
MVRLLKVGGEACERNHNPVEELESLGWNKGDISFNKRNLEHDGVQRRDLEYDRVQRQNRVQR